MRAQGELYPTTTTTQWGHDLCAVRSGRMTFDELFNRHEPYVTRLVKRWARKCPAYMSRDDYRQEIWVTVARALRDFDPNHPKRVPLPGWVGWRIIKRMQRLEEKVLRANAVENAPRYMDYLIVEERVLAQAAVREDGMLMQASRFELVTQPSWERGYDARQMMIAAVSAMPNARASTMIAKICAGASVKEAAPGVFQKCRRPNKAAHRAIAQAHAAVAAVDTQPLAQNQPENDTTSEQDKLKPLIKVRRRVDPGQRTQACASR